MLYICSFILNHHNLSSYVISDFVLLIIAQLSQFYIINTIMVKKKDDTLGIMKYDSNERSQTLLTPVE